MVLNEIEWLEKQTRLVDKEIEIANAINTNNAKQSLLIYQMWRTQLMIRFRELEK